MLKSSESSDALSKKDDDTGAHLLPVVEGSPVPRQGSQSDEQEVVLLIGRRKDVGHYVGDAMVFCWRSSLMSRNVGIALVVLMIVGLPLSFFILMAAENHHRGNVAYELAIENGAVWSAYSKAIHAAARPEWPSCQSLYEHSCGGMLEKSAPGSGSFEQMRALIEDKLQEISADGWPIIGMFYDGCMDVERREQAGISALQELLNVIEAVSDAPSFTVAVARLNLAGVSALFNVAAGPDEMNMNVNSLYVDAAYVIAQGVNNTQYRDAMSHYLGQVATNQALAVEHGMLAPYIMSQADKRRFGLTYNPVDDLRALSPSGLFDWPAFFELTLGTRDFPRPGNATRLILVQPLYALQVDNLMLQTQRSGSWESMKSYLLYRVVLTFYEALPLGGADSPIAQNEPLLARECLTAVENAFGDLLGHYYSELNFPQSSKDAVSEMVSQLSAAFERRIMSIDWMDEPTRTEALRKLKGIKPMVGFPDRWNDDLPPYDISEKDHLLNVISASAAQARSNLNELFLSVDTTRWLMPAWLVNAYYTDETIVITAAIASGAFFHEHAPLEVQYGALGVVIGHEFTHSFDDQGRMYNADGLRVNWWSNQSATVFEERAQCVVNLYNGFKVPSGSHVNGQMTLGENIADLGGLNMAYSAYESAIAKRFPDLAELKDYESVIEKVFKMTREKLFFRAYAYSWCDNTPDPGDMRLRNDVHSPPAWRVYGATSQSAAFAEAFDCPVNRAACDVW